MANLAPRRYRFRVTAASPTGVWSETGATLDFEVVPYFYQTRWFLPRCAALLVGAVTAACHIRIARLRANELELQRRVEQGVTQIIHDHSGADFSHSICPDCMVKLYPDYAASKGSS